MEQFVRHVETDGETVQWFWSRRWLRWPALALAAVAFALLRAGASQAVQLSVCSSGCQYTTIAAALAAAHDGDTIAVGPGTYSGEFTINHSIRLVGAGSAATTIVGRGCCEAVGPAVVTVPAGVSVTIAHLKITKGFTLEFGGGIDNSGTLSLRHALLDDNVGGNGGGIYNHIGASASVSDSEISDNNGGSINPAGNGGGIYNEGTISLRRSILDGNNAGADIGAGGGIFNAETGTATFSNSRIADNRVSAGYEVADGGGIYNDGTMTLWRTPVVENSVSGTEGAAGGGIANSGRLTLNESWVTENVATTLENLAIGGGVVNGGVITLIRSGVIRNTPDNCVGC